MNKPPWHRRRLAASLPPCEGHLLAIRKKIWTCIRALRALEESEGAGQARLHRKRRLVQGLSYWLQRLRYRAAVTAKLFCAVA